MDSVMAKSYRLQILYTTIVDKYNDAQFVSFLEVLHTCGNYRALNIFKRDGNLQEMVESVLAKDGGSAPHDDDDDNENNDLVRL